MDPSFVEALAAFVRTWPALVFAVVFGALWGSFFNVCIARLPRGLSVVKPGSHCFACGQPVKAYDNVPMLSYLWLRGRCRACGVRFSARYVLVEALMAALSGLLFWSFVMEAHSVPLPIRLARFAVFFAFTGALLVLSFIDLDTQRLPDVVTLPGTAVFFLAGFGAQFAPWTERAIGLVAGYVAVRLIADLYFYTRGREGLGLGDGKLLSMIGALLGWKALPVVVFSASLLGVAVSLPLLLRARRTPRVETPEAPPAPAAEDDADEDDSLRYVQVPFGPFLAASAVAYLLLFDLVAPLVLAWFG